LAQQLGGTAKGEVQFTTVSGGLAQSANALGLYPVYLTSSDRIFVSNTVTGDAKFCPVGNDYASKVVTLSELGRWVTEASLYAAPTLNLAYAQHTVVEALARSLAHTAYHQGQITLIARILELRREKARLLGYADFADLVLEDRMAKKGADARAFVDDLTRRTEAAFARENAELEAFREATGFLPEEQCVAKVCSLGEPDAAPYDMHVFPWVEPDPVHGWRCVIPAGLLRPRSTGTISLASRDPEEAPLIDHGYLRDDDDVDRLVSMLPWLADLARQEPLADLLGEPLVAAPTGDREDLIEWVRGNHHHYWHPTGGASIGPDGSIDAVCDDRAHVRGVEGLVVADASIFPRAPRATTAFPVTVIGEHVARLILEDT
jgi:hypothetical protein